VERGLLGGCSMKAFWLSCFLIPLLAVTGRGALYTFSPTPTDMYDLDHHSAYTWRVDNVNLGGLSITGATLTFTNIRNWDSNPNMLFIHLLDTAKHSGVRSFLDATGVPVPSAQIQDNFAGSLFNSNPLVKSTTGNTLLANPSFGMTPTTFKIEFSLAQLAILQNYIGNGNNFAFGFDPDCHFYNSGITFQLRTGQAVPDNSSTAFLLLFAASGVGYLKYKFAA